MIKAIIFDYDGVLQDTFELHRAKIKEFSGVDLSVEDYKAMHDGNFFTNVTGKFKQINWPAYRDFIYPIHLSLRIDNNTKQIILELSKKYNLFVMTAAGTKILSAT
ncbi:hypothetical protein HYT52_03265 [Candidatus Woesearchaeota archaeon]|nr:hypothetical protein [Candidatus Woesearchaeota archaeon]